MLYRLTFPGALVAIFLFNVSVFAENITEFKNKSWCLKVLERENTKSLVSNERLLQDQPANIHQRIEEVIDSLRYRDPLQFYRNAASEQTGACPIKIHEFYEYVDLLGEYHGKSMRTMRREPMIHVSRPDRAWFRYAFMLLPDGDEVPLAGELNLYFNREDYSLDEFSVSAFKRSKIRPLPMPDANLLNDPVRDRKPVVYKESDSFPPDFSQVKESSEYNGRRRVVAMNKRHLTSSINHRSFVYVSNSREFDQRRRDIVRAIWRDDEEAFIRLAASPITGQGGLQGQRFDRISREWKRHRSDGLRMMGDHPCGPKKPSVSGMIQCSYQWMTLPDSKSGTPSRGNFRLVFRPADMSLSQVDFKSFRSDKVTVLPRPEASLARDPVFDLPPVED